MICKRDTAPDVRSDGPGNADAADSFDTQYTKYTGLPASAAFVPSLRASKRAMDGNLLDLYVRQKVEPAFEGRRHGWMVLVYVTDRRGGGEDKGDSSGWPIRRCEVSQASVREFLEALVPETKELVLALRNLIHRTVPHAEESLLWDGLSYHRPEVGGRVKGAVCQIGVKRGQVRLDFIHGIRLADPHGLLQGDRKSKRFVPISTPKPLKCIRPGHHTEARDTLHQVWCRVSQITDLSHTRSRRGCRMGLSILPPRGPVLAPAT